MNIIGKAVHSKKYGAGRITNQSDTELVVAFIDKSVSYPLKKEVFINQLTFDNSIDQEKILDYFDYPDLCEYDDWLEYWDKRIKEQENRPSYLYRPSKQTSSSDFSTPFKYRDATFNIRTMLYLDVYDDFYALFHQVQNVYLDLARSKVLEYKKKKTRISCEEFVAEINNYAIPQASKLCTPVLQRYSYLFLDPPNEFQQDSFDYHRFSLEVLKQDENIGFDIFSFYSFLYRIKQLIVSAAKNQDILLKAKSTPQIWKVLMEHLALILEEALNNVTLEPNTAEPTDGELIVYDRLYSTTCHKESHPVVPSVFIAPQIFKPTLIKLPVHYCEQCKKHLIGIRTLDLYEDTFGKLLAEREYIDDNVNDYDGFALESRLHRYGYNVRQGIYTEEDRQMILMSLIDNNRMNYWEICKTLEQNIQMFYDYPNHQQAIQKWKEDLKFISDYVSEKEDRSSPT